MSGMKTTTAQFDSLTQCASDLDSQILLDLSFQILSQNGQWLEILRVVLHQHLGGPGLGITVQMASLLKLYITKSQITVLFFFWQHSFIRKYLDRNQRWAQINLEPSIQISPHDSTAARQTLSPPPGLVEPFNFLTLLWSFIAGSAPIWAGAQAACPCLCRQPYTH